jgi:hypothetical protein
VSKSICSVAGCCNPCRERKTGPGRPPTKCEVHSSATRYSVAGMLSRICHCGAVFETRYSQQKHCSPKCNHHAARVARMFPCAECGQKMDRSASSVEGKSICLKCRQGRPDVPCANCGLLIPHKTARKNAAARKDPSRAFCSRACATDYFPGTRRTEQVCVWCSSTYMQRSATQTFCSRQCLFACNTAKRKPATEPRPMQVKTCIVCAVSFTTNQPHTLRCAAHANKQRTIPLGPTSLRCTDCSEGFVHDIQSYIPTRCPACQEQAVREGKRIARDRRRAIKKAAFVENVHRKYIYERDGWRCQLCGKRVAKDKQVPHPKAPTIDHIVPLSWGGEHSRANTQLACFLCNSLKGDRSAGQPALIG